MSAIYSQSVAFPAWGQNDTDSSLVEVVDARQNDFGTQLLSLFKSHARITYNFDDSLLPMYIDSAIMQVEQILEFPILPRSYSWSVGDNTGWTKYTVPFRNTKAVGQIYDFEPLRGKCIIDAPASWPVTLALGFDAAADIPNDLKLFILDMAASMEQLRSIQEISGADLTQQIISRYAVVRC